MTWYSIRLELARTPEFPLGSPSRYYLLRLPLDDAGLIDEAALDEDPGRNTVRRFWPNEADLVGHLIPTRLGWAFSYRIGEDDDETIYHLETHPLRAGEYITLTEPDGERLPFKVAAVTRLNGAATR
ncbi:hypothetical protein [Sphingosinicella sp. YJ22]|uniref:hypothetical protein n=1 Tax=Sphingosinicella sp. YJ22 TaxID=1104780 RepID=UPI00140D3073|nr:hypothetical protein [Sphingosinicella sp. YJ22]